jgi:hypothetical protein
MSNNASSVKTPVTVALAMAAALLVSVALWAAALRVLYPGRLASLQSAQSALALLDVLPTAEHALVLFLAFLISRQAKLRAGLAAFLGLALVLIPTAIRLQRTGIPPDGFASILHATAAGALGQAILSAALPLGDLLSGGKTGPRRLALLAAAAVVGTALVAWMEQPCLGPFQEAWGLGALREAPFVGAWMTVPPPDAGRSDKA